MWRDKLGVGMVNLEWGGGGREWSRRWTIFFEFFRLGMNKFARVLNLRNVF